MSLLKKIWKNNSKHKKLCEDWPSAKGLGSQLSLTASAEPSERKFSLKYVGVVPVERACSAPATAAAIANAVSQSKAGRRKLQRVDVTVSPRGIAVDDAITNEKLFDVSIYRISYCSADAAHSQVFAFIASGPNDILECHAFLCPKRKLARAATLAAAQSFNTAYQLWQSTNEKRLVLAERTKNRRDSSPLPMKAKALIDLPIYELPTSSSWVSFDDETAGSMWDDTTASRLLHPVRS